MTDPVSHHQTEALIEQLASTLKPARRGVVSGLICAALIAGGCLSALAVFWLWGVRPDMALALSTWRLWLKEGFVALLAIAGILAMTRLARPDGTARGSLAIVIATGIAMALVALGELVGAAPAGWRALVMGKTWATCPWLILALAVPLLIGSMCAVRSLAPSRLRLAGAACGLASGALSALIYSISCDESAAAFVLVWYGGAIAVATLIGALLGPRCLRW